jgi:hypothetical protein
VVDIYDAAQNKWLVGPSLPSTRFDFPGVVVDGLVIFLGGDDGGGEPVSNGLYIDSQTLNAISGPSLNVARYAHAGVGIGHIGIFAGGRTNGGPTQSVEYYNSITHKMEIHTDDAQISARWNMGYAVVGTKAIFLGGQYGTDNGQESGQVDILIIFE